MLEGLKLIKPTQRWEEGLREGETFYSEESIKDVNEALDSFVDNLSEQTKKQNRTPLISVILGKGSKEKSIMQYVKRVVLELNRINERYYIIETVEREELCDFIFLAVKQAGLDVKEDITEEWRDW